MQLNTILKAQSAIEKIYIAKPFGNGEKFLRLKKIVKKLIEETNVFIQERNRIISEVANKEGVDISSLSTEAYNLFIQSHPELIKFITEMAESEIDISIEPLLTERDMFDIGLSIAEQDQLEKLGLVIKEDEK